MSMTKTTNELQPLLLQAKALQAWYGAAQQLAQRLRGNA